MPPARKNKHKFGKKFLKKPGTGRPPGRPWHDTGSSKVCLLCLRRFEADVLSRLQEELEEAEEENEVEIIELTDDITSTKDPLSDSPPKKSFENGNTSKVSDKDCEMQPKRKLTLYMKFLWLLSRYLGIKTNKLRKTATKWNINLAFCEECFEIVHRLCDVYDQWKKIRLILSWRLGQVGDTIKGSKEKISAKLRVTLLKNLSTQLKTLSYTSVDLLRKHIAVKCSAKNANVPPRVALKRIPDKTVISSLAPTSHALIPKIKLLYPLTHMQQYLKTLIVIFALATPPKEPPKPKAKTSKLKKNPLNKIKGIKKENIPPVASDVQIKKELYEGADGGDYGNGDDDHFGGSGPPSPISNNDDDDDDQDNEDNAKKGSGDSDWSMNAAASGNDSDGSVRFQVSGGTTRRWNLRRRTRSKADKNQNADGDSDGDEDYAPLPPARAPRGSKVRPSFPESEKKFSCNLCGLKFRLERSLKRHLSNTHSFLVSYTCNKMNCNFRCNKSVELENHKRKFHKGENKYHGRPTPCNKCGKIFPSKFKMLFHRKTTHKLVQKMECEICKKVLKGPYWYERHKKSHVDKNFQCSICGRGFATEVVLNAHLKFHESNPNWIPGQGAGRPRKTGKEGEEEKQEGDYKCEECGRSFRWLANFTVHKSLCGINNTCEVCRKEFKEIKLIRNHLRTEHEKENEKYFFCIHCDKGFTVAQTYDLHFKIVHPTKAKIECDVVDCCEEFENIEKLKEHLKEKHLSAEYEEREIELNITIGPRKEQKENSSGEAPEKKEKNEVKGPSEPSDTTEPVAVPSSSILYICGRCKWPFTQKPYLDLHMLAHTPPDSTKMFHCEPCKQTFKIVGTLQSHYNRFHGDSLTPYGCKSCGLKFYRRKGYLRHVCRNKDHVEGERRTNDRKEVTCLCGVKCKDFKALYRHKTTHHNRNVAKKTCTQCDLTFKSNEVLLQHNFDVHGMEKPVKCEVEGCGGTFTSQYRLKIHSVIHQEPTIPCTLCPKMFRRKKHLEEHIKVHYQIKDQICDFCGKTFVKKSSLRLHLDIHMEIKRYSCSVCGKKFCRKFARDCHERVHSEDTPFICSHCGIGFKQIMSLKNHVHKVHELGHTSKKRKNRIHAPPPQLEPESDSQGTEQKAATASTSGIIHEALQAAFNDINMELGPSDTVKEEDQEESNKNLRSSTGNLPVVANSEAYAAVGALVKPTTDRVLRVGRPRKSYRAMLNYGESPNKPEEEERNTSPAQTQEKDLTCGFCGKEFKRQKPFKDHVDKHLSEALNNQINNDDHEGGDDTLSSLRTSSVDEDFPMLNSESKEPTFPQTSHTPHTTPIPTPPPAQLNIPEPARKKRGRPRKGNPPGTRLAQIVDNVMEAATGRSSQAQTSTSDVTITPVSQPVTSTVLSQQHQQQIQYHHQQSLHQNVHHSQTHPQASPSPHSMGSERSTPAGSPAPMQHQTPANHQNAVTTASTSSTTPSFLSPFLLPNPYLIPGQSQPIQPQAQTFTSNQGRQQQFQQQSQSNYSNAQQHNQDQTQLPHYSSQAQLYHQQLMQQQRLHQAGPQDLSKSGFSMFFANPRN